MFTGIVEEIGTIDRLDPLPGGETRLVLHGPRAASDAGLGDSIAVDGVEVHTNEESRSGPRP